MTHAGELLADIGGDAIFDENLAGEVEIVAHGEAGGFHRRLQVHPIINNVRNELGVSERLVGSAHDPESDVVVTMLHEGWNDGMKGTLAGGERIGFGGVKHEQGSAVLQGESHAVHGNPRAEAGKIALDQRDNVAFAINRREIRGVARWRLSGLWIAIRLLRVDERGAAPRVVLGEQAGDRDLCESWVSVVAGEIRVGKLHRLN